MTDNDDNIPPLEPWATRHTASGLVADSVALDLPRCAITHMHTRTLTDRPGSVAVEVHMTLDQPHVWGATYQFTEPLHFRLDLASIDGWDMRTPVTDAVNGFLRDQFLRYARPVSAEEPDHPGGPVRSRRPNRPSRLDDLRADALAARPTTGWGRSGGDVEDAVTTMVAEDPQLLLRMPRDIAVHFLNKHQVCWTAAGGGDDDAEPDTPGSPHPSEPGGRKPVF